MSNKDAIIIIIIINNTYTKHTSDGPDEVHCFKLNSQKTAITYYLVTSDFLNTRGSACGTATRASILSTSHVFTDLKLSMVFLWWEILCTGV